jgi:hypothetical protein
MAQGEWEVTTKLIAAAIRILKEIEPATIRQTFYQLVVALVIQNSTADYRRVSRVLTIARRDGRLPFEWIVDRSRQTIDATDWRDLKQLTRNMSLQLKSYRRDRWQDQPTYVELILEKDAMSGSLRPIIDDYGLILSPVRGFDSTSNAYEIAERLLNQRRANKRVVILYCGDFDPSGECMERELQQRIEEYMVLAYDKQYCSGIEVPDYVRELCAIEMLRVAILKSDIKRYRLPPQRVKDSDPRAKSFVRKHGNQTVELDALNPNVLRARLQRIIDSLIDRPAWDRAGLVEKAQQETCERYAGLLEQMADKRMQKQTRKTNRRRAAND